MRRRATHRAGLPSRTLTSRESRRSMIDFSRIDFSRRVLDPAHRNNAIKGVPTPQRLKARPAPAPPSPRRRSSPHPLPAEQRYCPLSRCGRFNASSICRVRSLFSGSCCASYLIIVPPLFALQVHLPYSPSYPPPRRRDFHPQSKRSPRNLHSIQWLPAPSRPLRQP